MRGAALLAALLVAALVLGGCSVIVNGRAVSGNGVMTRPVDTGIVRGSDGGPVDELSTATLLDVQSYWRATFEPAFGRPWRDISGGFFSVDTSDPQAPPPPCLEASVQLEGNAFYCAGADAVAWDRAALLPVLREQYGDGGVVVVLAHEVGHAVHHRLGVDPSSMRGGRSVYPMILTEAMADCYAGSFVRWVADGNAEHLRLDQQELYRALSAQLTFRDPVGTSSGDTEAHGNAFDRVSAFQDGYQQGPQLCMNFTVDNRKFTQQRFTSYEDRALEGNLPFNRLLSVISPDLDKYYGNLVTTMG
ncbi:MAG: neutral zinc metallopeptidase, partial [Pseudonocardiaceae bacterium]